MRTFIIKARKVTTRGSGIKAQIGSKAHFEVIAHCVINAFFISSSFRQDVEVYLVFDSSENFPHTIKLSSADQLSIAGFHEAAVVQLVERALQASQDLKKNETRVVAAGIEVSGFGFDKLIANLGTSRVLYLLSSKGQDIRGAPLALNPVFILSDHLALPRKTVISLKNKEVPSLSVGKKMLFASQCVVLINDEMDRQLA